MRKLTPSERKILERLIFPESFNVIEEETEMHYGTLRDDLINLVNYRYIEVMNTGADSEELLPYFDSDNIRNCTFKATKTGLINLSNLHETGSNHKK